MATTRLWTIDEIEFLPQDEQHFEIIRGELVPLVPAAAEQGEIASVIIWHLMNHIVQTDRGGKVYTAEAGFVLARDPDILVAPDVAYVSAERLPPRSERRSYLRAAPDLAIEIRSPTNRRRGMLTKVEVYLENGVRIVWSVDPPRRQVTVSTPVGGSVTLGEDDTLDGGDVLPGFTLPVAALFA